MPATTRRVFDAVGRDPLDLGLLDHRYGPSRDLARLEKARMEASVPLQNLQFDGARRGHAQFAGADGLQGTGLHADQALGGKAGDITARAGRLAFRTRRGEGHAQSRRRLLAGRVQLLSTQSCRRKPK